MSLSRHRGSVWGVGFRVYLNALIVLPYMRPSLREECDLKLQNEEALGGSSRMWQAAGLGMRGAVQPKGEDPRVCIRQGEEVANVPDELPTARQG